MTRFNQLECFFKKLGQSRSLFPLFSSFQIQLTVNKWSIYKFLPMTGFGPRTSGIGSACSINWATTNHCHKKSALFQHYYLLRFPASEFKHKQRLAIRNLPNHDVVLVNWCNFSTFTRWIIQYFRSFFQTRTLFECPIRQKLPCVKYLISSRQKLCIKIQSFCTITTIKS